MTPEILPSSPEAELGLLQSLFAFKNADRVLALVADRGMTEETCFSNESFSLIFGAAKFLRGEGVEIDFITVKQRLVDERKWSDHLQPILADCQTGVASAAEHYRDILFEKHQLRSCYLLAKKTALRSITAQDEAPQIIAEAAQGFGRIGQVALGSKPLTMAQHLKAKIERLEAENPNEGILKTGLFKLDKMSRVKRGDMPLIKAEEKIGKSMLAVTMAGNMILEGHACGYITLEMPVAEVIDRLHAGTSRVPMEKDHQSKMNEGDYRAIAVANTKLTHARFEPRDDARDLASVLCVCREWKRKWPDLAAVFVDYAQLIDGCRRKGDTKETEIATISRSLRALSIELNTAFFVLSQVNKDGDARESKSLEQDATAIWHMKLEKEPGKRIIAVPRQRNGESGIAFPVSFLGNIARVEDFRPEP